MNRYAVADLHGQLDLLLQIKEYINDNDILYVLGDSGDRGPEPWRTLKLCLDDPQIVYLMGNHDLILIEAIKMYLREENGDVGVTHLFNHVNKKDAIGICYLNDGIDTLLGWAAEPQRMKYYQKLRFLPLEIRLAALDGEHFIYLNHSGVDPDFYIDNVEDFLWERKHFYVKWEDHGNIVVGGHTPYVNMTHRLSEDEFELKEGCMFYNGRAKINIDKGACFIDETVLLNLDTLKGTIFITKGENVDGAQGK